MTESQPMGINRASKRIAGAFAGVALFAGVIGCQSSTPPSKPVLATSLPTSFDPCHDIPAQVLSAQHLMAEPIPYPEHETADPSVKATGCQYLPPTSAGDRGSGVIVQVTNMTVDYFQHDYSKAEKFDSALYRQFKIDNRAAATQGPRLDGMCTLVVDIKDGGIRLDTLSQKIDPCQLLMDFANAIAPHLSPPS